MAPVIRELRSRAGEVETVVCATGQHREMLEQVILAFGIAPDLELDLMRADQTLAELSASSMIAMDETLERIHPEALLVQGDTTTAMIGALAAFYRKIPVGHVEAGLRTGNPFRPFPEEINRRVIGALATWNFTPTLSASRALLREGAAPSAVHLTGNTVIDALLEVTSRPEEPGA